MNFNEHGPPGVSFELTLDGEELPVSPWDGSVEGVEEPCVVELGFYDGSERSFPLAVNRDRRDRPITPLKSPGCVKIKVAHAKKGEKHLRTFPNSNNVRILSLNYGPAPALFTVALVSQGGEFFLTCDKTYEFVPAPEEAAVTWYYPKKWDNLVEYVELITGQETDLSPQKNIGLLDQDIPIFNQGVVNWWDSSLGLGSVWVQHNGRVVEAAIHWSEILEREDSNLVFLRPEEKIIYQEVIPKRKTTKYDSEFKYELVALELAA